MTLKWIAFGLVVFAAALPVESWLHWLRKAVWKVADRQGWEWGTRILMMGLYFLIVRKELMSPAGASAVVGFSESMLRSWQLTFWISLGFLGTALFQGLGIWLLNRASGVPRRKVDLKATLLRRTWMSALILAILLTFSFLVRAAVPLVLTGIFLAILTAVTYGLAGVVKLIDVFDNRQGPIVAVSFLCLVGSAYLQIFVLAP